MALASLRLTEVYSRLIDPYNAPVLRIRRPGSDTEEVHTFENDDPFFSEVGFFLH